MLCEVIAYILSRQRLSAKTFVAGYFFMLCRIDCLCGCCATPPVSEASLSTSPRVRPSGITRGYAWCVPSRDSGCGLGGFSFLSLSTSLLLHGFTLRASPAVTYGVSPPGTVGADWEASLFSPLLHFSTGSPFGHHPRLRIVCPCWGQWVRVSS